MSQEAMEKILKPQIKKLFVSLEPNENDSTILPQITENIKLISQYLSGISQKNSIEPSTTEDHSGKNEAQEISNELSNSNAYLDNILGSLKGIVPESFSKPKSGEAPSDSIEIIEFYLGKETANTKEEYTIKIGYNGSKVKENVQILFCNSGSEIPLFTIKHLLPYTKPSFKVLIPFDLFFNSQYANLVVAEGDTNLVILEIFPIEIQEVMPINENLQLKIKSNVGVDLNCIIHEENLKKSTSAVLKAGEVSLHTIDLPSGKFSVYSANYKRSNIKEI